MNIFYTIFNILYIPKRFIYSQIPLSIMKRKVIKQGHNTLTITIPSKWAKRFNLSAGDEIDLTERENGLFISTERRNELLKTELVMTDLDIPTVWKYFMAIYREGYDEITAKFDINSTWDSPYKFFIQHKLDNKYGKEIAKKTPVEFLQELVNRFIGYEIINYGKDFVIIKEMSEPTSREFDNALRRVFLLLQQMAEEICDSLNNNNVKTLSHIHDIDTNLDKFHDYCIRILNKIGNKDLKKTSLLFSTLYFLELIGDEFKNISHHLIYDFQKDNYKNIKDVTESIKQQFDLFYEIFYKFNKEKVIQMSELDKGRYFNVEEVYKKVKKDEEKEIFHHLRIITRYINALTELRIEMEF